MNQFDWAYSIQNGPVFDSSEMWIQMIDIQKRRQRKSFEGYLLGGLIREPI